MLFLKAPIQRHRRASLYFITCSHHNLWREVVQRTDVVANTILIEKAPCEALTKGRSVMIRSDVEMAGGSVAHGAPSIAGISFHDGKANELIIAL